jgi:hypothetical protein
MKYNLPIAIINNLEIPYPYNFRQWTSILTLFALTVAGIIGLVSVRSLPYWTWGIFFFAIIGAAGGLVWEFVGDLNWRSDPIVEDFRRANVGLVRVASFISIFLLVFGPAPLDFMYAAAGFFLVFYYLEAFLSEPYPAYMGKPQGGQRILYVIVIEVLMEVFVLVMFGLISSPPRESRLIYILCIVGNILNLISFFVSNISWAFHGLNTIATFLYAYSFSHLKNVAPMPYPSSWQWTLFASGCGLGFLLVMSKPILKNQFRFHIVNGVWQAIYGAILATPTPQPVAPGFIKGGSPIKWTSYDVTHPKSIVTIPSAESIPLNQRFPAQQVYQKVTFIFSIISFLDQWFPQSNVNVLPTQKPLIDLGRTPEFYVPSILLQYGTCTRFIAPRTLYESSTARQQIAWMTLYGHCNSMIQPNNTDDGTHQIDFTWLKHFEAKPGYRNYGGKALFHYNRDNKKLQVTHISAYDNEALIEINNTRDNRLEKSILRFISSTGLIQVAGYHLCGIHFFLNMVSLSLYNSFDVIGKTEAGVPHPFRYALNINFYNHVLVAEKTTAHLLDKGAVFNQIFALSHQGISNFINHYFTKEIEFGREANLLQRYDNLTGEKIEMKKNAQTDEELLLSLKDNLPVNSQLYWQIDYKVIFLKYAKKIVSICWPKGQKDLTADQKMINFYKELSNAFSKIDKNFTLPGRYQDLATIEGVTLFLTDCIFTTTVLHEVWGTKVPSFATTSVLFPSYQQATSGTDGNDLPATLEDYLSLLLVTGATSRVKYPQILQLDPTPCFDGLEDETKDRMFVAWEELKTDLKLLEVKWTANPIERDINDEYCRILPSELDIAAGY